MYYCSIMASKTAVKIGEAVFSKLRRSSAVISSKIVPSSESRFDRAVQTACLVHLQGVIAHGN